MAAMKSMKATDTKMDMKAKKGTSNLTYRHIYRRLTKFNHLQPKDAQAAIGCFMGLAAAQVNAFGSFEIAAMLKMKLKVKPAKEARTGLHPFTKKPYVFKAKAASKTVIVYPLKKFVRKLQDEFADSD